MAVKASHILGMNGRYRYTKMNPPSARKYGFSKLLTKDLLHEHDIPTAEVYFVFSTQRELEDLNWATVPAPFVIKPASGSAGKGVVIVKEKTPEKLEWKDQDGNILTEDDLDLHIRNILDGEFSTWGSEHKAIVEEMIVAHPTLMKYSYKGTPDIRVIVFNSVPVMAMIRIPTPDSQGKANLDQGAIGLGIDMATGITIGGLQGKSELITHFPNSKKKVNGILIPMWKKVLQIAVEAATAAGYVYMGADIFIHAQKGPMIVELNGFPGLSIQLCNRAGLKRRLDRVEDLEVRNAEHGVKISQALFAESFADEIKAEEGLQIISVNPMLQVHDERKKHHSVQALVNTGRFRSVISEKFAESLGLVDLDDLLWRQQEGIEGKLPVIEVTFKLKNRTVTSGMLVSKRMNRMQHKIELGRKDLGEFVISMDES